MSLLRCLFYTLVGSLMVRMIQPKVWLSWLKWISWFIYSYEALLVNQWSGVEAIACSPEAPNACQSSGEQVSFWIFVSIIITLRFKAQVHNVFALQVLQRLSFKEENLGRDIGVLLLLAVAIRSSLGYAGHGITCYIFRLMAYLALVFRTRRKQLQPLLRKKTFSLIIGHFVP